MEPIFGYRSWLRDGQCRLRSLADRERSWEPGTQGGDPLGWRAQNALPVAIRRFPPDDLDERPRVVLVRCLQEPMPA